MQNTIITAKLTFAVLLFFSTMVAVFWPQGLGATFERPNQLHLGFGYSLLLSQALLAAVAVEHWPAKNRALPRTLLTLGVQLTLTLISTMPIAVLLYWGGYLTLDQFLFLYGAAAMVLWGFTAMALRKRSHVQVALAAVVYLLGLSALLLFFQLTPWTIVWSGLMLVAGLGYWWQSAAGGGDNHVRSA